MIIRQAQQEDAKVIADCLLLAMEDIAYHLVGEHNYEKAIGFLSHFTERESNQYSYQNCWVIEIGNEVIAAVNLYDGAKLFELRKPILNFIEKELGRNFFIEEETQQGEFYVDCIGVNPNHQGKGVGLKILSFLIDEYVVNKNHTLGLLVDENNPRAKKLYLKLGFKPIGVKSLLGKRMEHLQINKKGYNL